MLFKMGGGKHLLLDAGFCNNSWAGIRNLKLNVHLIIISTSADNVLQLQTAMEMKVTSPNWCK